jgi:hypothetical protein
MCLFQCKKRRRAISKQTFRVCKKESFEPIRDGESLARRWLEIGWREAEERCTDSLIRWKMTSTSISWLSSLYSSIGASLDGSSAIEDLFKLKWREEKKISVAVWVYKNKWNKWAEGGDGCQQFLCSDSLSFVHAIH